MKSWEKRLENFANLAIIITALVLIGVVGYKFLKAEENLPSDELKVGENIPLADVNWAENKMTLVLVLQENCRFCTESMPFYQKIAEKAKTDKKIKLVAVFPDMVEKSQTYLKAQNVEMTDVKQANLANLKVGGTPTLILVDEQGKVIELWTGKLRPDEEEKVLRKIFCNQGANCS